MAVVKVTAAQSYDLYVATDSGFASPLANYNPKVVTGLYDSVKGLAPKTNYFYRLIAEDGSGKKSENSNIIKAALPDSSSDGYVYVGSMEGKLYCFSAVNGQKNWSFTTAGGIEGSPTIANGMVIITSSDQRTYSLNPYTGAVNWFQLTGGAVITSPATGAGQVFVANDSGNIIGMDITSGFKRWTVQPFGNSFIFKSNL